MTHEDIIERAAESIMQRANDTYPRTLHKDMLRDEIGKAVREASKKQQSWPPAVAALGDIFDPITASHNEARRKLSERMIEHYYGKPE